jgi:RHS repeat-associated protein
MKNRLITPALIILGIFTTVFGQQHTENSKDQTLRGSGRVNPSTLGMEFDLPLGSYPGRGINVPISLSYSSKVWRTDYSHSVPGGVISGGCRAINTAKYAENSASGWTTSLAVPYIEYVGKDSIFNDRGFPLGDDSCDPNAPPNYGGNAYVRRVVIHLPSGETHELRADDIPVIYPPSSNCFPTTNQGCDPNDPSLQNNWDRIYYAVDGSNIRYIEESGSNSYVLQMPDGSYYDFANTVGNVSGATARKAIKFTDRNNNYTTYNDQTGVWTDTLDRSLTAPIGATAPAAPTTKTYTLPGMTGNYKFYWKQLKGSSQAESGLTDFSQSLRYLGDKYAAGTNGGWGTQAAGTFLFGSQWSSYVLRQQLFNPVVLTEIELPTGQRYKFTYDIYGRIERIYYPTGGEERFVYSVIAPLSESDPENVSDQTNFGVTNRKVYQTAGQGTPYNWNYGVSYVAPAGYKVSVTSPDNTISERLLHRGNPPRGLDGSFGFDNILAGMSYEELNFSSAGQLVTRKLTNWSKTTIPNTPEINAIGERHPRVTNDETIIYDTSGNGVSSTVRYEYEGDLNQRETPVLVNKTKQYAFVTIANSSSLTGNEQPGELPEPNPTPVPTPIPPTLLRTAETTFLINDQNIDSTARNIYKGKNMVGLATAVVVKDAAETVVSRSEMKYDESGYSPNVGRANPTTSRVWDSTKGAVTNAAAYISTRAKFDNWGNQYESIDAKGNATTTVFDAGYHAFPIQVTTAVPDTSGINGSSAAFTTTATFNLTTGLPLTTTDANGLETRIEYDPVTLRPKNTKTFYQNAQVGSQSETIYNDVPNNYWVKSRTQIDANNWAESITYFDGLGRAYKSEEVDAQGNIFTEKEFDAQGRVKRVTNPFRATEAKIWTTNVYDEAGRVKEVVTADNAKVTTAYGVAVTGGQIGTIVTVTDQAGKQRRSVTNALGQLIRVDEPNDVGSLGTIDNPAQPTNYAYDTLSNLTTVSQGVQTRTFQYDSLARLKQANNPESGIINYNYDNNGNLTKKTDARNIRTIYDYDALNRIVKRCYRTNGTTTTCVNNTDTPEPNTLDVSYTYDNLPNAKGRLIKVDNGFSKTEYTEFDTLGRVKKSKQTTDGTVYNEMLYGYNLSGALIEETYPSGRVVKNTLDNDGDLSQVQSRKANDSFRNYANSFTYTSAGAVSSLKLGNGKWENTQFNSRLQPIQIGLGASATSQNSLKLNFDYGGADNNGNVKSQQITVPTVGATAGFTAVQTYTYDSLNRIKDAKELIGTTQQWKQTFTYDRYGNRRFDTANGNTTTLQANCPTAVCNPTIDPATNKLIGYTFDASGNTKVDAESRKFTYDGENKQVKVETVDANGNPIATIGLYFYDGDGKRIKKISNTETTIFVYNASGQLVAEYSTQISQTPQVGYLTNDHLGSPRITTDANGQVISRRDFQPFGEEIARANYGTDNVRQKFTGYEKDKETELDFAQARYYSSKLGRFYSTDPENYQGFSDITKPQSWNAYAYVNNNPCRYTDPSGTCICLGQRWSNWREGYGFRSDESVENEYQKRLALVQAAQDKNLRVEGQPNVSDMTRRQVWDNAEIIRTYLQNNPLESDESQVDVNNNGTPQSTPEINISPLDIPGGRGSTSSNRGKTSVSQIARELGYSPSKIVKNVLKGNGKLEQLTAAERELAAKFYERVAKEAVGGKNEAAARALNEARAKFLREGGKPPIDIHNF